jgi:hypothetical protein
MEYDPSQFRGSAQYYLRGRPPYSARLAAVLAEALGLDGTGTLVDVGAGPGTLSAQLGNLFERVVVVEPDPDMLAEARRHLAEHQVGPAEFVQATAEELPRLGLAGARVVAFGQSFHRVDRISVANAVHGLLADDGAMVLVTHDYRSQPRGPLPTEPPVPHHEIRQLVRRFLGPELRSGTRLVRDLVTERFEETLARTRFGAAETLVAPGRTDLVRDTDDVVAGVLSMSYAAPGLLGDRLEEFLAELRAFLLSVSPTGRFWEWPGDTEILIARTTSA